MRSLNLALAIAAAALAVAPVALAQNPPATAERGQADAAAQAFVAALQGDDTARRAWVAAHVSAAGLKTRSADDWVLLMRRIQADAGEIRLVETIRRPRWLDLRVEVGASRRLREISLAPSATEAGRFDRLWAVPWPLSYPASDTAPPADDAALAEAVRRRIEFAAANDDFSGAALVLHDGRALYQGAFGDADREQGRRNRLDTPFSQASAGKMFTTVAVAQLIDAGRLSLDTRLIDVLPDYPNPDAARRITVRQLLSHSAGLGSFFDRPGVTGDTRFATATEALGYFADQPLLFEPGSAGEYSNEGFVVLGAIVEWAPRTTAWGSKSARSAGAPWSGTTAAPPTAPR